MLKLAYHGELEAFQTRVVEELFLWQPEMAIKFIDRICRQNVVIKTFISVKIAPHIGYNRRQDRNVIII